MILLVRYAVNVPFWDQWELVELFKKFHTGNLGFNDFFAQHNEHRIVFPRIIMFTLGVSTNWNVLYEVAVNVVLAAASFFFLYLILRKTFERKMILVSAAVLTSFILFSPIQWENWLWGWQIQWFLNVLGLVLAIWALSTWTARPLKRTILAAVAAFVATYSLASGFFVWLVCIPLFLNKDLRRLLPVWIITAAVSIAAHDIGYVDPSYHPSKTLFLSHKLEFIRYLIVYLSHPVVADFSLMKALPVAYLGFSCLVLVYVYLHHKAQLFTILLPWLSLALYASFAAGSTAISRLGLGVEQAYRNRYITLSNLFLIALCVIIFKVIELSLGQQYHRVRAIVRSVATMVMVLIIVLISLNYAGGIGQLQDRSEHLAKAKQCALLAKTEEDPCLLLLYPRKPVVWERLNYLRDIHWGGL